MPTRCSESGPALVTFRGGFVADWHLVARLLDIEARGCTFQPEDNGRFRVTPADRLTPADRTVLRARRDEARRIIDYYSAMTEV